MNYCHAHNASYWKWRPLKTCDFYVYFFGRPLFFASHRFRLPAAEANLYFYSVGFNLKKCFYKVLTFSKNEFTHSRLSLFLFSSLFSEMAENLRYGFEWFHFGGRILRDTWPCTTSGLHVSRIFQISDQYSYVRVKYCILSELVFLKKINLFLIQCMHNLFFVN